MAKGSLLSFFDRTPRTLETLMWAAIGAALANSLRVPGAAIIGAIVAIMAAGIVGRRLRLPGFLRDVGFCGVGIGAGAALLPETLSNLATHSVLIGLLPLVILGVMLTTYVVLRMGFRMDIGQALRAALPFDRRPETPANGQALLAPASQGGRPHAIQAWQIFALAVGAPLVTLIPPGIAAQYVEPAPLSDLLVLGLTALTLGILARLLRVQSAWLVGPFVASAVLHASGLMAIPNNGPLFLISASLVGAYAGLQCLNLWLTDAISPADNEVSVEAPPYGQAGSQILSPWQIGGITALLALGITLGCALLALKVPGIGIGFALLALLPAGSEAVIGVALLIGAAPALVAIIQIARILLIPLLPISEPALRDALNRLEKRDLEHRAEKWEPVFGKSDATTRE